MSNTKHTPGPWLISPIFPREIRSVVSNGSAKRISLAVNNTGISDDEAEANAKLIAAAPELLESLIRVIDRIEENDFQKAFTSAYERAKAAIKRAIE